MFFSLQEFKLNVTEEFFEYCLEGSLAIEIYGHRRQSKRKDLLSDCAEDQTEEAVASLHDSITQKNKHLIDRLCH